MVRSRRAAGITVGLVAMALAWLAWQWLGRRQVRDGLAWATRRMDAKQFAPARDRLAWLSTWCPRQPGVAYLLGACEAELGHPDAALEAWGDEPPDSRLATLTALARGRLFVRARGRLADAETCYRAAAHGAGPAASEARWALAELLLWEGRFVELRRLLRDLGRARPLRDRIRALREHWGIDSVIVTAEEVQPFLDQAARTAADDDRAWLARASFATRYGRYAEARDWLDRCQARHPDDPVLARARLQWALAAGKPRDARQALARIPAESVDAAERWSLLAWFATRRRDAAAERSALEDLIAIEPGNTSALDRLAALALQAGDPGAPPRSAAARRKPSATRSITAVS